MGACLQNMILAGALIEEMAPTKRIVPSENFDPRPAVSPTETTGLIRYGLRAVSFFS